MELRHTALQLLLLSDPAARARAVRAWAASLTPDTEIDTDTGFDEPAGLPAWPSRPALVAPSQLPHRTAFDATGRAALLHAVAHIEYNAIALALDAELL